MDLSEIVTSCLEDYIDGRDCPDGVSLEVIAREYISRHDNHYGALVQVAKSDKLPMELRELALESACTIKASSGRYPDLWNEAHRIMDTPGWMRRSIFVYVFTTDRHVPFMVIGQFIDGAKLRNETDLLEMGFAKIDRQREALLAKT